MTSLLVLFLAVNTLGQNKIKEQFEALDAKQDHKGIVALWKANPSRTLSTIDSYLEGALAIVEGKKKGDAKTIKEMHARALRGALAADEAFGRPIFSDYASSFIGWTPEQQKMFRQGQKENGLAGRARRDKKFDQAYAHAKKCHDLARPLGDWWGTAMGLTGMGQALEALGRHEEALAAHSSARLLYADLGLRSEATNLMGMARMLVKLDRKPRADVVIKKARAMADNMGRRAARMKKELDELEAALKSKK